MSKLQNVGAVDRGRRKDAPKAVSSFKPIDGKVRFAFARLLVFAFSAQKFQCCVMMKKSGNICFVYQDLCYIQYIKNSD